MKLAICHITDLNAFFLETVINDYPIRCVTGLKKNVIIAAYFIWIPMKSVVSIMHVKDLPPQFLHKYAVFNNMMKRGDLDALFTKHHSFLQCI